MKNNCLILLVASAITDAAFTHSGSSSLRRTTFKTTSIPAQALQMTANYYDDFEDHNINQAEEDDRYDECARVRQKLECAMGDDWRSFRASLVAGERLQQQQQSQSVSQQQLESQQNPFISGGDPFATSSAKSSPSMLLPTKSIDEDDGMWAHPLSHAEPGCVLVANEKLGGTFHRAVILITSHRSEEGGCTGLILNKPLAGNLLGITSKDHTAAVTSHRRNNDHKDSILDLPLALTFASSTVSEGGPPSSAATSPFAPRSTSQYTLLHDYGPLTNDSLSIGRGVYTGGLSCARALARRVRRGKYDPRRALFVRGCVQWAGKGRVLDWEVEKGVWYAASVCPRFILGWLGDRKEQEVVNGEDLWESVMMSMGGRYADVAQGVANNGDARMAY